MKTNICDRCGGKPDMYLIKPDVSFYFEEREKKYFLGIPYHIKGEKHIDLCGHCFNKFKDWMKSKDEKSRTLKTE